MDKKKQLDELRAMRAQVIGELRNQHKLGNFKDLLLALVSLQETQLRLEQWERLEKQEHENENTQAA